jgi:pimeloyl-ACP methyl ester carboxylesterase
MQQPATEPTWRDLFFTSRDGLRLHARHYPSAAPRRRPALCLPGLTRNSRDFHDLAAFLSDPANPQMRDVYTVDYRGRGRSQSDPDWRGYSVQTELADVLDFMTVAGLHDAAVIGTSRGGLIAMIMAALRPTALGAVVLNDIGPVIDQEGLLRIVAYVGRVPLPATWDEAALLVQQLNERQFPAIPAHHWADIARQWFNDDHGRPMHGYDQALGRAMAVAGGELPTLWPQFEALSGRPTLVIRGELSDILSEATVSEMRLRHPNLDVVEVKGQGHAPLLRDRPTQIAIAEFLARADAGAPAAPVRGFARA